MSALALLERHNLRSIEGTSKPVRISPSSQEMVPGLNNPDLHPAPHKDGMAGSVLRIIFERRGLGIEHDISAQRSHASPPAAVNNRTGSEVPA